ncbi:hypothetical protein H632_c4709p0, partial [Helicosporidium sp. ATCC 50920]
NAVAIDLIAEHIRLKLQQHDLRRLYANLQIIPSSFQIRGMHTIIRDANTSTADFAFYADRLLRLVVEAGLGCLPFEDKFVFTPTGRVYAGVEFAKRLCGVSIIRSGEAMENALRACCNGIKIGKILIHRSSHPDGCQSTEAGKGSSTAQPASHGAVSLARRFEAAAVLAEAEHRMQPLGSGNGFGSMLSLAGGGGKDCASPGEIGGLAQ